MDKPKLKELLTRVLPTVTNINEYQNGKFDDNFVSFYANWLCKGKDPNEEDFLYLKSYGFDDVIIKMNQDYDITDIGSIKMHDSQENLIELVFLTCSKVDVRKF